MKKMMLKYIKLSHNCIFIKDCESYNGYNNYAFVIRTETIIFSNDAEFIRFFENDNNIIYSTNLSIYEGKLQSKLSIYVGSYLNKKYLYCNSIKLLINFEHSNEELNYIIANLDIKNIFLFSKEKFVLPTEIFISCILD